MPELLNILEDWNGFKSIRDIQKPGNYEQRLKETIDLLANAHGLAPHRREFLLREAMTTSDFPLLFGDVFDRSVMASYKAVDPVWKKFGKQKNNKDFRAAYLFAITGGDQYLTEVAEKAEYPGSERDETRYSLTIKKYGRKFDISWESLVNDDLGALNDTAERFARAAQRTEHRNFSDRYAGDIGTHAGGNLYENAVNKSTNSLTIANLETAIATMLAFTDQNGEPIMNRPKYLVVPPLLEFTARAILTSASKMWVDVQGGAGASIVPYPTTNVVPQMGLELVVDPYLPVVDTTNPNGWYLFSDPKDIAALAYGYLQGHDRPEICMKASDKVNIGGGEISPLEGDFDSDNVKYRVRLTFGTAKLDWRATYMGGAAS